MPRFCLAGIPQHVIQRGNNRQPCFAGASDYRFYLGNLRDRLRFFTSGVKPRCSIAPSRISSCASDTSSSHWKALSLTLVSQFKVLVPMGISQ